ncbi:hypothetical protein GUJ93_ZPchr0001g33180 [Zizania palustris]|uniref:Uncharacterized protein n=1 Tax=Zizania palustris TaxID=103762 RepID=A0A8J5VPI1_ZIZPA|nr:hypothetical protein GUJ93_ZPchr0001g33180 [Zizania palustris]
MAPGRTTATVCSWLEATGSARACGRFDRAGLALALGALSIGGSGLLATESACAASDGSALSPPNARQVLDIIHP